ncbi:hypothetical protein CFC21_081560 [Triticum aestivum]|uniref:Peptidase S26 domain-containing protein n=3 Tax=Triticum TaxID=4564 RepID=A0A9R1AVA4_TRITD|nr:mitochondrial inner membrane protease subunit 1-like [Triticum dicoccoides]XP_037449693.1 mitochondrial inner membrane protease subunit 1-like [Triticum dicoccoides]XP_037449694.1 mitochondrial inner membrane protease subunit 1-like [Triticum dicoccoides]XP_044405861.1 mitochondrial inner membrane protease subunit 1-like [Triticum aestivum]XP_044405862.1 mitochondrial inner membrane protease subunit 1-like [Triticum aestivum]XP_044405863.1 mitochondrial inner membrane protease subunit 1-lik
MSRFVRRLAGIPWRQIAGEAFSVGLLTAQGLCAVHVVSEHVLGVAFPRGPSMLPALNMAGDVLLTDKVSPRRGWVGPGDVVLLLSPEDPRKIVAKRVLGMEGDEVTYPVDAGNSDATKTVVVPQGHIWVQGDNIYSSNDSRQFGPVPYGLVKGKMSYRIWPPSRIGAIDSKE